MKHEPISIQQLKLENQLLWKFVALVSDADDTYNGKMADAIINRFGKNRWKLRKSRMRLPKIEISSIGI